MTIYCTTNGTTPTTSSPVCSGTITVSTSETIQAFAAGNGYSVSPVASATYTITPPASAPAISPVTGTYTSVQTVTMNDSTPGAVIHYTLDNSQPTASSPTYSSGFAVSTTTTVKAIAVAAGYSISPTTTSVITIQIPATINFGSGFSSSGLALNGSATLNGTRLRLTNTVVNQAGSAWYTTPVNIQTFTTDFTFQLTSPTGNGITFTIQNAGTTALGPTGGVLAMAQTMSPILRRTPTLQSQKALRSSSTFTTTPAKATTPLAFISMELHRPFPPSLLAAVSISTVAISSTRTSPTTALLSP